MLVKHASLYFLVIIYFLPLYPITVLADYSIRGSFDSSSPTHDRRKAMTSQSTDPSCNKDSVDSYNNNVRYAQYIIKPTIDGALQAHITTPVESSLDTLLALYCAPFDPENPENNLVAIDDDGNGYPDAGLTSWNISVAGNTTYHLVVMNYSETYNIDGSYDLVLGDSVYHKHSLKDLIVVLLVLSGASPSAIDLDPLSDLRKGGNITLAHAIMILKEQT